METKKEGGEGGRDTRQGEEGESRGDGQRERDEYGKVDEVYVDGW